MVSQRSFFGVTALLFAATVALTIVWRDAMPAICRAPMPAGSETVWTRMPGQTWPGAAASFLGMWVVMMGAMMLPSLAPILWRYRQAVGETRLTALVGAGYFFVWTAFGLAVFPLGAALMALEMRVPSLAGAVPVVTGVFVLISGAVQFTAWKAHHLACCREIPAGAAWQLGMRLGLHCVCCGANLTAILLVIGIMDFRIMALVTAAITAERLAPSGAQVAWIIGVVAVGAGLCLVALG